MLSVECRSVVATCLSWLAIIDFEVRAVIVVRSFNIHLHSQTCPTCVHTYIHTHTHTHTLIIRLNGGELFDYVIQKDYLDEAEATYYMKQILAGLAYVHKKSIVHLDLKVVWNGSLGVNVEWEPGVNVEWEPGVNVE